LQKYIPNPYLISRRKFDFRVYALLTYNYIPQLGGPPIKLLRGYFYEEGYLRTSCKEFTLKSIHNKYVHLTNDAVQKYSQDYGKFENGNKVSYEDFKNLLMKERNVDFNEVILSQIKEKIKETFEAAGPNLVGEIRYDYNGFELMGFDFMLDADLKLYMIECNTNPCLETATSILLQRLIPNVLDQTCKIAVDPFLRANEQ
jgi:tubulin--tyrosine ligase